MKQNKADYLKQGKRTFLIRITRVQNEIELWNGIRNDGQSEMNPASTFFHVFPFFGTSFAFSIPLLSLPLFLSPFLFFFYSEKRSCGWEMRELAFRGTYWYLFSRRRKYSTLFPFPSPFNSLWIR